MKIINSHSETVVCPPEEELEVIRHSAAHIMAQAIQHLWPEADFAFGPATDKGFYYDVDLGETKLTDEDLQRIEDEMRKIVKENLPFKSFGTQSINSSTSMTSTRTKRSASSSRATTSTCAPARISPTPRP